MEIALHLTLTAPGVSTERIQEALLLAKAVFENAGVTPGEGVAGLGACELWDIHDFAEDMKPSTEEFRAADALMDARNVAMRVCYGHGRPPSGAALEVVR
jgi:hypothetical protein